jgi:hypothetical protein
VDVEEVLDELRPMTIDAKREHLRDRWPLLHGPLRSVPAATIVALFRSVGFITDGPPRPESKFVVWRGAPTADAAQGVSWSATRERAAWYARGYTTEGETCLWQATCPAGTALARFTTNDEVVVDPALLVNVTVDTRYPRFEPPRSGLQLGYRGPS